ncbi:phosphomannose isomerase type II C-terminal cupin domain [uncultured Reyranella sp.]|jgi:mannose-6-phosphate isomerase-like protein (cupin superfamily)|uniref:phosphomannose isomerase type II C-terminal cupin domain n=1 Tax=uncultured Reyranella sp. TaxID=735512 RepID=UPI00259D06DF|nr:phosphomannose isomerase type II C-terminal cupin domain [uncultured Reyranella sp.]
MACRLQTNASTQWDEDDMPTQDIQHRVAAEPVLRPWGAYESIAADPGYQVKRIVVAPGGCLSRQRHARRAEHWVVVQGTAIVELDGIERELRPDQSIYIPLRAIHRLTNRTDRPLVLIEVQCGDYVGEDDIERFDDVYGRT